MSSDFVFYSIGIVVADKKPGSDFIEVCPIEKFNIQEPGLISESTKRDFSDLKDKDGKGFNVELTSKKTISSKWLPLNNSNRVTAPDVYRNETVMLYKFSDAEEYYWNTSHREPSLRKLETVLYCFSNVKDLKGTYDLKTSYWFLMDTRNKKVSLHTSDNDGEAASYDIEIDTKNGIFTVKDNKENSFVLNSTEGLLTGKIKKDIDLTAGNNINLHAKKILLDGETQTTGVSVFDSKSTFKSDTILIGKSSFSSGISSKGPILSSDLVKAPNIIKG